MASPVNHSLGKLIFEARKSAEFSLREVAARVGVNHVYISDIERGRRIPSELVLKKLSAQLGLDFDQLMAMAGRFGKTGDAYLRKHPMLGTLVRQVAEDNLDDEGLGKLLKAATRLGKKH